MALTTLTARVDKKDKADLFLLLHNNGRPFRQGVI